MTTSPAVDGRKYRDTIGRFATGVTVVTMDDGASPRGMTANAIASVSLEPTLLLVCVERSVRAHAQLEAAGAFAVNILAADQVEVSRRFARSGVQGMEGVAWRTATTGAPIIEGVLAWLDCRLEQRLDGGDHSIFLGRVVDLDTPRPEAAPLLFWHSRYYALGPDIPS